MSRRVVVAGWGQSTQRKEATPPYDEPLDMMERSARDAARVAGDADLLKQLDAIFLVRTQSRMLSTPAEDLAGRLGATPRLHHVSGIGGHEPQYLVSRAARMIARGELDRVLVAGAETFYPRSEDSVRGEAALMQGVPPDYASDDLVGSSDLEARHGVTLPIHGFPLFETALWADSGLSLEDYLERVGTMWSGFSEVAARHPNAWTRTPKTAKEIVTPKPENRPIAFPYTKSMVSLVMADLGAAVLLCAEEHAPRPPVGRRPVYFAGGGFAKDRQRFMIEKRDFRRSPSLAAAARKATERSGIPIDEVACFDLYSCFPCAVSVARRELGLSSDDPRPLTLTGGLGFFGGPGSNFSMHGIATLAERIAEGAVENGLVTAIGWFMHKYAVGIYTAQPPTRDVAAGNVEDERNPDAGEAPVAITEDPGRRGRIDTYTIVYRRDRTPALGVVYGTTDEGERFIANTRDDASVYRALTESNQVGRAVEIHRDDEAQVHRAELV